MNCITLFCKDLGFGFGAWLNSWVRGQIKEVYGSCVWYLVVVGCVRFLDQIAGGGIGKKAFFFHQISRWPGRETKTKLSCGRPRCGVRSFEATAILLDQRLILAVALTVAVALMILRACLELARTLVLAAQDGHRCGILSVGFVI